MTGWIGFQPTPSFQRGGPGFQQYVNDKVGGDDRPRRRTRRPQDDGHVGWEERFDKEQARKAQLAAERLAMLAASKIPSTQAEDNGDENLIILLLLS